MSGIREKRYHDALRAIERTKARREQAIKTLVKCEVLLPQLERKARRLGAPVKPRSPRSTNEPPAPALPTIEPKVEADGIPDFLRRKAEGDAKDAVARAEIEAEREAERRRKADRAAEKRAINKEVLHAELTGQRRKMPLSGKAALEHIQQKP